MALLTVVFGVIVFLILQAFLYYKRLCALVYKIEISVSQMQEQLIKYADVLMKLSIMSSNAVAAEKKALYNFKQVVLSYESIEDLSALNKSFKNAFSLSKEILERCKNIYSLKNAPDFLQLEEEIHKTEAKVIFAKMFYNEAAKVCNSMWVKFPEKYYKLFFSFKDYKEVL